MHFVNEPPHSGKMLKYGIFVSILLLPLVSGEMDLEEQLQSDFLQRVHDFVNRTVYTDECGNFHTEVLRLSFDDTAEYFNPCIYKIMDSIDKINSYEDVIDFELPGHVWLLNKFWNHPLLVEANNGTLRKDLIDAYLHLPMWMSDDAYFGPMQFWSENHQIGWMSSQYLIGHAFAEIPELSNLVFYPSKLTGAELRAAGRSRLLEWLDYRIRFGFAEFNSDTYGPIAYEALITLPVLAPDEDIRILAKGVQHLLEFDHIIGSLGDRLCSARGRAYTEGKVENSHYRHLWMLKNVGTLDQAWNAKRSIYFSLNMLHGDSFPTALLEIGLDVERGDLAMRERFGLGGADRASEGVGLGSDCWFWLGQGAYFSPDVPECMFYLGDTFDLWNNSDTWHDVDIFEPLWPDHVDLIRRVADFVEPLGGGPVLGDVNVYTYRSGDFLVSSAQDYHKGWMAGQQHVWQMTHDIDNAGTVFSHQPLIPDPDNLGHNGKYWQSGAMPRVLQFGTTVIAMHNPHDMLTFVFDLNMTHVHFNKAAMDEVVDDLSQSGWIFGRDGDTYMALFSALPADFWQGSMSDLVAPGTENVYIAEFGTKSMNGSFEEFKNVINGSQVTVEISPRISSSSSSFQCFTSFCANARDGVICAQQYCNHVIDDEQRSCLASAGDDKFNLDVSKFPWFVHDDMDAVRLIPWPALKCLKPAKEDGFADMSIEYVRTGDGRVMSADWNTSLIIDGHEVPMSDYPRYDNKYAQTAWGDKLFEIHSENCHISLDFNRLELDSQCGGDSTVSATTPETDSTTIETNSIPTDTNPTPTITSANPTATKTTTTMTSTSGATTPIISWIVLLSVGAL